MYVICDGLARLLAPILPVTADDLWRYLPGPREASVHLADFPAPSGYVDRALLDTWDRLMRVRQEVTAALELKRKEKVIGTSLGARVVIHASGPVGTLLERYREELPVLYIVSDVALEIGSADSPDSVSIEIEKAPGVRCDRCWRYVSGTRTEPTWAGLCDRCVDALAETVTR